MSRFEVPASPRSPGRFYPAAKRTLDVVLSAVGLVASAPVWPLLAVAIKVDDGGPVFYAQSRVGKGGGLFRSLKFRSMVRDSDERFGRRQAEFRDARITRVGRFMRATGLDELPQLWNILKGEMSWVGPRALQPSEEEVNGGGGEVWLRDVPGFAERHSVRPGLTGLAQVCAPRDVPVRRKFRYDLLYVRRRSLRLDVTLFVLSCWISVWGKWEHRGPKV